MKKQTFLFFFAMLLSFPMAAQEHVGHSALLVIDVQDEFTRHTMADERATLLISNINEAIEALRPMKVIFVKADIRMLTISLKGIKTESSEHTALDDRLERLEGDLVLTKQESSALTIEQLSEFLQENEIGHLYLTGIFLGQCLTNTAIHAVEEGYQVTVIRDAVTAKKSKKSEKYLKQLEDKGIKIVGLADCYYR